MQAIKGVRDLFAESRMSLTPLIQILMAVAWRIGACRFTDADIPRSGAAGNQPFAGCRPRQAGAGACHQRERRLRLLLRRPWRSRRRPHKPGRGQQTLPVDIPEELTEGATLFRNRDQEFERALKKESAERRVSVVPVFAEAPDGFVLTLTDEDGVSVAVDLAHGKEIANNAERAIATLREQLGKFGNTMVAAEPAGLLSTRLMCAYRSMSLPTAENSTAALPLRNASTCSIVRSFVSFMLITILQMINPLLLHFILPHSGSCFAGNTTPRSG